MPSLPNSNDRNRVIAALRRAGFEDSPGGKHTLMHHPDGRYTTIPNARRLNIFTLRVIVRQCGLTVDQFLTFYSRKG